MPWPSTYPELACAEEEGGEDRYLPLESLVIWLDSQAELRRPFGILMSVVDHRVFRETFQI